MEDKMRPIKTIFSCLMILLAGLALDVSAQVGQIPDFVELSQKIKPAVVNIRTSKTVQFRKPMLPGTRDEFFNEFFERFFRDMPNTPRKERSLGSGFIISADGFILTNNHVVDGADEIGVRLADGRTYKGVVRGLDPKLDLALIKIDTGKEELPVAKLGDSDSLRVGEWVIAIGNPFGLEQTVTVGIVSAKGRVIGAGPYDNFIQTDASINPGNSGGPLFNAKGEVVGINTAIVRGGQGIGFATPVNAAKNAVPQLRDKGKVVRGWLGVTVQDVSSDLAKSFGLEEAQGALVSEVVKDSPADKAGIQRGDIILSFNGNEINILNDLPRLVADRTVGEKVEIVLFRDGRKKTVQTTLGQAPEDEQVAEVSGGDADKLGMTVSEITPETMRFYNLKRSKGILVTQVAPDGPAAAANLRPGDLILEINNTETPDLASYRKAIQGMKQGQIIRLLVQRGSYLSYTTIQVE
ncbi:MAG: DegQ family serine endoprotease [Desulfuromonadaceae bacterium]|nr:DegQ family serine endoprotease [Desulfuromonadaceae bacterium]